MKRQNTDEMDLERVSGSPLFASLLGPPELTVDGQVVSLPTRRAVAVLAVALIEGGEVSRERLCDLLWGPGHRRNLRQELYTLRRAPHAAQWLSTTRRGVTVSGRCDLHETGTSGRGPLLQGLTGFTPAWDDWLAEQRLRWADRTGVEGLVSPSAPVGRVGADPTRLLALMLALCEQVPAPDVLAQALGLDPLVLVDALDHLDQSGVTERGALVSERRWQLRAEASPTVVRALHRRLADALRSSGVGGAQLAHHLEWAGDPSASAAWLRVGRENADVDALERALDAASDDLQRTEALTTLLEECRRRARFDEAEVWADALQALALSTQHPVILARAAAARALVVIQSGDVAAAEDALAQAVEAGGAPAYVLWARAAIRTVTGRIAEAQPLLRQVVEVGTDRLRMQALNALGACRAMSGDPDGANLVHHEALALARDLGERVMAMRLLNSLGANAARQGDLPAAIGRLREAVALASELGDAETERVARGNLAATLMQAGQLGDARPLITRTVEGASTPRARAWAWHLRGMLERHCGRHEEAAAWAGRAAEGYVEAGDAGQASICAFYAASSRFALGTCDLAEVEARLDAVQQSGREDHSALAALVLADLTDDPDRLDALLALQPADPTGAAAMRVGALRQRSVLLRDRGGGLVCADPEAGLGEVGVARYRAALCAAAVEPDDPERAAALRRAVATSAAADAEGLLASQRESFEAMVARWLEDPVLP